MPYRGKLKRIRPRRKAFSQAKTKAIATIAKRVAMGIPEVKVYGWLDENRQLIHNKTDYLANFLSCKQGVADPNNIQGSSNRLVRLGDEYYLKSINMRLWLSNKKDRPNVMYKAYLFWYDSDATLSDVTCYFTQQNKMLDRVNDESISVIDSKTIFSGPSYAQTEHEHSYLCTLKQSWKQRKITYDEGGDLPKKRTIGMMVVAYDAFGTLQSDNIASYAYNCKIEIIDP